MSNTHTSNVNVRRPILKMAFSGSSKNSSNSSSRGSTSLVSSRQSSPNIPVNNKAENAPRNRGIAFNPCLGKNGGYAVATAKTMSWLNTPVKQDKSKGRKSKTPVALSTHTIFAECAEIVSDPYWKSILSQCSTGKFPKGFNYRNGFMTFKHGTKIEKVSLTSQEALVDPNSTIYSEKTQVSDIIIKFIQTKSGMRSQIDKNREKQETQELTEEVHGKQSNSEPTKWSDVPQKQRINLINNFTRTMGTIMSLNVKDKKKLLTLINLGFIFGYFTSDNVNMENGVINSINGLAYNPENSEFIFDTNKINTKKTSKSKSKIVPDDVYLDPSNKIDAIHKNHPSFLSLWVNYLTQLFKDTKYESKITPIYTADSTSMDTTEIGDLHDTEEVTATYEETCEETATIEDSGFTSDDDQ